MLDVFDELLANDPSLRLLIAGKPLDVEGMADLEARCAEHPRVVSRFERIPDDELQVWYGAADLAVLPYTNILNSAAFRLAMSFGVPAVGPRMGALAAYEGKSYVRLFDPDSPEDLRNVVRAAVGDLRPQPPLPGGCTAGCRGPFAEGHGCRICPVHRAVAAAAIRLRR